MKKQCKRRVRPASEPAMVMLATNPEVGITERMAIQAMRGGWADYANSYRVLADCHGTLTLGVKNKRDSSIDGALRLSMVALLNIFDRFSNTGKVGATGDELAALELLVDVSEDFWKRQSHAALLSAMGQLRIVREKQIQSKRKGNANGSNQEARKNPC